jgi:DNA-binding NarL/FixJ family response regulator
MTTTPESTEPIRILVADDHPLMREGVANVLRQEPDMRVVAEADGGRSAIDAFRQHRPDVAILDVRMPDIDGVSACAAICGEFPNARIAMLSTFGGDVQALRALKAGASAYLLKSAVRTELLSAIRTVHRGRRYVSPEIAETLSEHVLDELLSDRELEVLKRVAEGKSNKHVAGELQVTEDTVKAHMKNISSKLSARDRTHAVMIAIKRGFFDGF